MRLVNLKFAGAKPAAGYFNACLWNKLHSSDQQQIQHIITDTAYRTKGVTGRNQPAPALCRMPPGFYYFSKPTF